MTTTKKQRGRLGIFGFMVAGLLAVVAGLLTGVGTASAHHPVLTASVSCDGTVSWTATAWMPGDGNTLQRTNPEVHVYYQNNGVGTKYPLAVGEFSVANNFSFSGTFQWPDGIDAIFVTAEAVGPWGNGVPGGATWYQLLYVPEKCDSSTSSSSSSSTSTSTSSTTSTTQPVITEPTVTDLSTTTTKVASEGPTTTLGSTTTVSSSGGGLPSTGSSSASLLLIATGMMSLGTSAVLATRRRRTV